jgi:UDP-N-acetylmuramate dehydrogenase
LPTGFAEARERAEALSRRTSLRVGGRPRFLFEPADVAACVEAVRACCEAGVPLRVLGGGCNLLVPDGVLEGAVLATRRLRHLTVHPDRVEVGAGNGFPNLVRRAMRLGIPGLPGCPGIPGSVGGVVSMNAGGRFGSVADALVAVEGVDAQGRRFLRAVRDGDLGYRRSVFQECVVTGAVFRRDPAADPVAAAALHREALAWKRRTQPLSARSAGCIFRNPSPGVPAGRLIEEAGLKGLRVGGAMVSPRHANFIVNTGGATSADVHALIERVRAAVRERHGVDLDLEVRVWP